jgi:nucleoside-diphosphate-sugar epimerase
MRILFTGGSSFTGTWIIRALARAGHEVTAVFRKPVAEYTDPVRRRRVEMTLEHCRPVIGASFGDDAFLSLVRQGADVLCHHAADVTNYKSPDFDAAAALANNTRSLAQVLEAFRAGGGRRVVLTGSVFEASEGAGSQGLPDFSPYGLSKTMTAQMFRFYCERARLALGKFVIPNPIGPFEEPRFTAYLMKSWLKGETPGCSQPAYVRDNIHVSLLAAAYEAFVSGLSERVEFSRTNPSGYAESMGAFTLRLSREMSPRLGVPCEVTLAHQTEFSEPRVRINTDIPDAKALGWDESEAWDAMARYYQEFQHTA